MNGYWGAPTARKIRWPRPAWRSDHITALIVYVAGTITMIAAGVCLILLGPQG